MYVRLAFAVAAHLDPEILVVDEVLAVGDAAFQGKCLGKMGEVSRSGRTILFVSHNMAAVSDLCSRALVFENGREVFSGSATGAVTEYIHRITRRDGVHRLRCSGCEIADLWFENAAKQRVATASIGQPLTAAIEFVVSEPNASQTMVLQFSTSDGSVVWTAETTPGVLQKIQSSGRFSRISVEIPQIMLYAKTYFVGVGIMNYGEGPIVWDRRFTQLTVVSNSALPHQGFDAARVNSVFMPHTWSAPNQ
jgi:lipopolysaccharide transport system ATP-binding protein